MAHIMLQPSGPAARSNISELCSSLEYLLILPESVGHNIVLAKRVPNSSDSAGFTRAVSQVT